MFGMQLPVQGQVGQGPLRRAGVPPPGGDVRPDAGAQHLRPAHQGDEPHGAPGGVHLLQQGVEDLLPVEHPGQDHVIAGGAAEEPVQQKGDVAQHQLLRLLRHPEGVHVPAPVPVQKHAVVQQQLQRLPGGGLAHAHGPADQIQGFHRPAPSLRPYSTICEPKAQGNRLDLWPEIA